VMRLVRIIDDILFKFESFLLYLILTVMIVMAFLQVILRNFFSTGILWADIFLRHLVLWVGFIGASIATREEKHINIDVLTRLMPERMVPWIKILIDSLVVFICVLLTKAAYVFVSSEYQAKSTLFLDVPAWIFQAIIPIGFALIGLRFVLKIIEQIWNLSDRNKDNSIDTGN